jgi:hypothetical protein
MVAAVSSSDAACISVTARKVDVARRNLVRGVEHAADLRAHVEHDRGKICLQLVERLQDVAEIVVTGNRQVGRQIARGHARRERRHCIDGLAEVTRQQLRGGRAGRGRHAERDPERQGRRAAPAVRPAASSATGATK